MCTSNEDYIGPDDYLEEVGHSTWLLQDLKETLHTSMVHILAEDELKDWRATMEHKGIEYFNEEVFERMCGPECADIAEAL
jgi:hypothetical protein